jgi:hypothetical protein
MFEYHNNILCVHGGWLYKEAKVITKFHYDNYVRRGPYRIERKGGGKNTPALIAWVSIHEDTKEKIIAKYGNPEKTAKKIIFTEYLNQDIEAVTYFKNYQKEDSSCLTEDLQAKYVADASVLKAIKTVIEDRILKTKALGTGGKGAMWKKLATIVHELPRHLWPHSLPKNSRSLQRKYKQYCEQGYEAILHAGIGHKNSEKVNEAAKEWLLARWADRVKKVANLAQLLDEYNEKALHEGWKLLQEEKTIYNHLYEPTTKSLWWGYRYGELKAKEKFQYQNSTNMPTLRDSLWYSDGTKLNYYYKDENGKISTMQVYEVMDAFSEVLLGYHISKTEDYEAQYFAYKMAVKNSGHRPYQLGFDNQGGHKKLQAGQFLHKLSKLSIKTQPYNGKSKTIESAFGRFQTQYLKRDWFFTGQNITAKKDESKANMEFILANASNLPSLDEIKEVYAQRRLEWNSATHPKTGVPRLEMYERSVNEKAPELNMFEMVDIFWILRDKPVTVNASGISFTEKGHKYEFVVYNDSRLPDVEWLSNNIDRKVYVKFDPEDLSLIYLYEKTPMGLRFITAAETKLKTARNIQEQEAWESEWYSKVDKMVKDNRVKKRDTVNDLLEKHGMLPEQYGLNSPVLKGIESQAKHNKSNKDIGAVQKAVSNKVYVTANGEEEEDTDVYDLY